MNYLPDKINLPDTLVDKPNHTAPLGFKKFSLNGQAKALQEKMLAEKYILEDIALLGQITAIYAKPNTGKTLLVLHMLISAIQDKRVEGKDIYYVNADDTYNGLTTKVSLAEAHQFEMLAPGHNGFEVGCLQTAMAELCHAGQAQNKIVILDTLKKFTDLMNKEYSSQFMQSARNFVLNGGSLILLAHCNKNRDSQGRAIPGGTSDIIDDADCVYLLDEMETGQQSKTVRFENIKLRGNVAQEIGYRYSTAKGLSYSELIQSVERLEDIEQLRHDTAKRQQLINDVQAIASIQTALTGRELTQGELIQAVQKTEPALSKNCLITVLTRYNGEHWQVSKGQRKEKKYHLPPS